MYMLIVLQDRMDKALIKILAKNNFIVLIFYCIAMIHIAFEYARQETYAIFGARFSK